MPVPELDGWRASFDQAAACAEGGDVGGATRLLCDLRQASAGMVTVSVSRPLRNTVPGRTSVA